MDIQAEKIEILKLILETNNPGIIKSIKGIFSRKADFWEVLPQDQKDDILHGITEVENGDIVDYEELMTKHRSDNEND